MCVSGSESDLRHLQQTKTRLTGQTEEKPQEENRNEKRRDGGVRREEIKASESCRHHSAALSGKSLSSKKEREKCVFVCYYTTKMFRQRKERKIVTSDATMKTFIFLTQ